MADDEYQWLKPSEAAALIGVNKLTLANWRFKKVGPRYYKFVRVILYKRSEVEEWIAKQAIETDAHGDLG